MLTQNPFRTMAVEAGAKQGVRVERQWTIFERFSDLTASSRARDPHTHAMRVFAVVAALMGLGFLVQASHAATTMAPDRFLPTLIEQALLRAGALIALLAAARVGLNRLRPCIPALTVLVLVALVLCYVPGVGASKNGSWRWIDLGVVAFQPSELARVIAVLWIADRCVRLGPQVGQGLRPALPMLAVTAAFFLLIVGEVDLGGALILACCLLATMFVGGVSARQLVGTLVPMMGAALAVAWMFVPYVQRRIGMFLGHETSTQVQEGLAAIGRGGLAGLGLSHGVARNRGVPYLDSDFVFAQIGEEFGWLGMLLVLGLFAALLWNGLLLVLSVSDRFLSLASFGLLISIGLQVMVHVQVVSGLAPPKGMTLPFISHGGTSLFVSSLCAGLAIGSALAAPPRSTRAPSPI